MLSAQYKWTTEELYLFILGLFNGAESSSVWRRKLLGFCTLELEPG
jgi:hypothetical protein